MKISRKCFTLFFIWETIKNSQHFFRHSVISTFSLLISGSGYVYRVNPSCLLRLRLGVGIRVMVLVQELGFVQGRANGNLGHSVVDQQGGRPNMCRPSGNKPDKVSRPWPQVAVDPNREPRVWDPTVCGRVISSHKNECINGQFTRGKYHKLFDRKKQSSERHHVIGSDVACQDSSKTGHNAWYHNFISTHKWQARWVNAMKTIHSRALSGTHIPPVL